MANPSYVLQWSDHPNILASAVQDVLYRLPDVTFICDETKIPASKLVLSACSPFLYSLIKDQTLNSTFITMPDTNPDQLTSIMSFLHTGMMTITKDDLDPLMATAHQLQLECLSETTEPCEKVSASQSEVEEAEELFDSDWLSSRTEQSMWESDELKYQMMLRNMIKINLKMDTVDGGTNWQCLYCDKTWLGNSIKGKRNARRHMESHLHVRVQCGECGSSFKTRESFWNSKCKCSGYKHKSGLGFIIVPSDTDEVNKVEDDTVDDTVEDKLAEDTMTKDDMFSENLGFDNKIGFRTVKENLVEFNNNTCDDFVKTKTTIEFEDQMKELVSLKMAKVDTNWHCLVCGKLWPMKKQCTRHMESHLVGITLPCDICDKNYGSKKSLKTHKSRYHRNSSKSD